MVTYKNELEEVIRDRLEDAANPALTDSEKEKALRDAMELINKSTELDRADDNGKHRKFESVMRVIEVVAIPVGLIVLDNVFKMKYMRDVCNFEKDYTFTTTPGRSISSFFRFKR